MPGQRGVHGRGLDHWSARRRAVKGAGPEEGGNKKKKKSKAFYLEVTKVSIRSLKFRGLVIRLIVAK